MHKNNGIICIRNFFFYTLFYVLFYSGVRPEELVGLQWKFIDLREGHRTIAIRNAISNLERQEHALERVVKGQYRTKNPTSVRTIPIFDFYYELLKDYKESYRYEFNLTKEEIEEEPSVEEQEDIVEEQKSTASSNVDASKIQLIKKALDKAREKGNEQLVKVLEQQLLKELENIK